MAMSLGTSKIVVHPREPPTISATRRNSSWHKANIAEWPGKSATSSSVPFGAASEQAAAASTIVDEAVNAGLDSSHTVTHQAKMLRLELLKVEADLERDLGQLVLDCSRGGQTVHWVAGIGVLSGHWAHREPAPHHEPAV